MPTEVVGAVALRKALNQYAPDLAKELTKELGAVLKPIVRDARGYVPAESPMSGWAPRSFYDGKFPTYNASVIKSGIVYKTSPSQTNRAGFKNTIRIQNKSMIGAIYETAGRKNGQGQEWVGPQGGGASKGVSRSNNPYMMPRVGRGKLANVFYNTGHGHLGWTLSAVTADMVGGVVHGAMSTA